MLLAFAAGPLVGHAITVSFTVTITAKQVSCTVGGPCWIHIVLKNTSARILPLPEERSGGEQNYRVSVWLSGGSPAKDTDYGRKLNDPYPGGSRSFILLQLNPGDEKAEDLDVSRVADLSALGNYTVQVERMYPSSHIKSNKLTLQVAP